MSVQKFTQSLKALMQTVVDLNSLGFAALRKGARCGLHLRKQQQQQQQQQQQGQLPQLQRRKTKDHTQTLSWTSTQKRPRSRRSKRGKNASVGTRPKTKKSG